MEEIHPAISTRRCDKCKQEKIGTLDFLGTKDYTCRACKNEYNRKKKKAWGQPVAREYSSFWFKSKK